MHPGWIEVLRKRTDSKHAAVVYFFGIDRNAKYSTHMSANFFFYNDM